MRLTILSDIHLEFSKSFETIISRMAKHKGRTDICVLAGDIGHHSQPIYSDFLFSMRKIFPRVIVIPGNHEYFVKEPMSEVNSKLHDICQETGCIFLNKSTVKIDQIKFIGCTLWSNVGTAPTGRLPLQKLHLDHLSWLGDELSKKEESVVITHHCPSFKLRHRIFATHAKSNHYYSDLDHLIKYPIKLWICGHTHWPNCTTINNIPIIINPVGYVWDIVPWNDSLVVSV